MMSGKGVEGSLSGGRALSVIGRRRRALAGGVAAAILFAAVGSAHADWDRWDRGDRWNRWEDREPVAKRAVHPDWEHWERRHPVAKRAVHPKKTPSQQAKKAPKALQMPLIAISITNQRLTLYDRGEVIAQSPVSTGMPGHPTPTGVFSVIQKQVFHESNIYSGAPMPYMQRITWSGVAMHAGVLPGHPASHGCIRMPYDFAVRLYSLTRAGARVIITRNEIAPVAFEHPGLFQLPKPAVDSLSQLTAPPGPEKPGAAVKTAQRQSPTMMSDAGESQTPAGVFKPRVEANAAGPQQDAEPPVGAAPAAADAPKEPGQTNAQQATQESAQEPAQAVAPQDNAETTVAPVDNASAEPREPADLAAAADAAAVPDDAAQDHAQEDPEEAVKDVKDAVQIGARPAAEPAPPALTPETAAPSFEPATGTVMVKSVVVTPAQPIEMPKTFEQVSAPKPESAPRALEPVIAPPKVESAAVPFGPERPLRPGPITVFVSKKEGKVFVRKGFQPVFSAPVTVARPELPLGTHLFTASEALPDGVSFRWLELSLSDESARAIEALREPKGNRSRHVQKIAAPPVTRSASAAEALDRVEIPAPALARISALMSQGATLIISDQGLGPETGTETDFIVLTR
jgi:L,D-transpeptidase catalytic domain